MAGRRVLMSSHVWWVEHTSKRMGYSRTLGLAVAWDQTTEQLEVHDQAKKPEGRSVLMLACEVSLSGSRSADVTDDRQIERMRASPSPKARTIGLAVPQAGIASTMPSSCCDWYRCHGRAERPCPAGAFAMATLGPLAGVQRREMEEDRQPWERETRVGCPRPAPPKVMGGIVVS